MSKVIFRFSTLKAAFVSLLAAITPLDDTVEYFDHGQRKTMANKRMAKFDDLWDYESEWVEAPNARRGGWSGVNKIDSTAEANDMAANWFLKRQQNHVRRTLVNPLSGIPTFVREFKMLQYLRQHELNVPKPVYFGTRSVSGNQQAILLTEELTGYRSLEDITRALFSDQRPTQSVQFALASSVAKAVRKLHDTGVQHRSLYPKHIFVKMEPAGNHEVAFIDLEKSRITFSDLHRLYKDLAALDRHSDRAWSSTKRLYFFKQYMGIDRLTPASKRLCRMILHRSAR